MPELTRREIEELLPLYVTGDLEESERRSVERALAEDSALRAEEEKWRHGLGEVLAATAPAEPLDAAEMARLEQRLLAGIESTPQEGSPPAGPARDAPATSPTLPPRPPATNRWMAPLALAASLVSLVIVLWVLGSGVLDERADMEELAALRRENLSLAAEIDDLRGALERSDQEIQRVAASLRTLGYPRSAPVVLAGLEPAPDATGATFYRPNAEEALFFAFGLPELSEESTYQLWFISDGTPVSAGTFEVDTNGEGSLLVADVPPEVDIDLWAVTREPAGGSPQPTGPMLIRS